MMLLVDMGNTAVKWSTYDGASLAPVMHCDWAENGHDVMIAQWLQMQPPERVVVSSVAGHRREQQLLDWVLAQWGLAAEFVRADATACGVINAYRDPERLGVDRWAALIAAHKQYDQAMCVVDCGTAVTIDVVLADGRHQGGLIMPGYDLMRHSLAARTSIQCDEDDSGLGTSLLARDTYNAIRGGCLYAIASLVDRVMDDFGKEMGIELGCVMTGGYGEQIAALLRVECRFVPDLVLQGLVHMARESR